MSEAVQIAILGDICPTANNEKALSVGKHHQVFDGFDHLFQSMDYVIANLECPLTNADKPISKSGPALRASPDTVTGLASLGIDAVGLANNHIRDYGSQGLRETIRICQENDIVTVGAGENIEQAQQPLIVEVKATRIGIFAVAENEFASATAGRPGANPYDPLTTFDQIRLLREQVDLLIVLYHGGLEHYEYPSPMLQRVCRKLVESGADAVICQHSHCIGSCEWYNEAFILYGQGNFLFDAEVYQKPGMTDTGLIVTIRFADHQKHVELIPVKTRDHIVGRLSNQEKASVLDALDNRSAELYQPGFVERQWKALCNSKQVVYIPVLLGHGRLFYVLNRLLGGRLHRLFYRKRNLMTSMNIIRCESHREALLDILRDYTLEQDE